MTLSSHGHVSRLVILLLAAAVVRLLFFTGLSLGDDVFYMSAAAALAEGQGWPPLGLHWHTRLGITVPTGAAVAAIGWHPFVFIWLPFAASLFSIWFCFHVVRQVAGERAAWIAAILLAAFPLEVIYSTHLFPDLAVGTLSAVAVWLWVTGLKTGRTSALIGSGLAASAAYLCRETVFMEGPVFLALWFFFGRVWRPRLLWVAVVPAITLLAEAALYAYSTGDPLYRLHAIVLQQSPSADVATNAAAVVARRDTAALLTRPLWMLATSHEFSVVHLLSLPLAFVALWRRSEFRWVAIWLLAGLGWLFYGTTIPTAWVPMHPDPRYAASFTVPALVLIGAFLARWPASPRIAATAGLVVLSLVAASLDKRGSELTAHRAFLQSDFARSASLEPFEYFGARWVSGLDEPVAFACAADKGRDSVVRLVAALPGAVVVPASERRYFVYSPERRVRLAPELAAAGWLPVREITGTGPAGREWLARLLRHIPALNRRFAAVGRRPRLVVLENPNAAVTREAVGSPP